MIDALLARLERDAEAEIARVTADARAEAAAIAARVEEAIARRRADVRAREEKAGRAALDGATADARREARHQVLAARDRMLGRVFAALDALLPEIAVGPAYRAALPGEVAKALAFTGDQPGVLRCAPALAAALARVVKQNGRLTIRRDATVRAGFRLDAADGSVEVDGTLAGRLERLRPRLAIEALAALHGAT